MSRTQANLLLLLAAVIWGTTFVAQQDAMDHVGPFLYTGARFLLGALVITPLVWREHRQSPAIHPHPSGPQAGQNLKAWLGLGVLLFAGISLQQIGVAHTSVTNAGFLTALYVPWVPFLAWVLHRHRPHISVWPAVAASLGGTYLLAGGGLTRLNEGDWWMLASTVFWGLHVVYVGRVVDRCHTPVRVAWVQFVFCGALSLLVAAVAEPWSVATLRAALPTILYGSLLSVGIGYTLQVVAQLHTRASDAAVLLSTETLFAGLAGALVLGERLSPMQLAGCALLFASIVAVQWLPQVLARSHPPQE